MKIRAAAALALILLTAGSAFAEEKKGEKEEAPPTTIQFMSTGRGLPQIWLTEFKISGGSTEARNQIHNAMPRVIDEVIVRLTSGRTSGHDPEIADVKQAVTEAVLTQVGNVEGLEVAVLKLGHR